MDVLSPGNKIYSTLPGSNNHGLLSGTSMASPIVSNIAALIRSYFPKLTAIQVKDILIKSVWQPTDKNLSYLIPQREVAKKLEEIGKAGGIVNAANAIQLAKTIAASTPAKSNKKKRSAN